MSLNPRAVSSYRWRVLPIHHNRLVRPIGQAHCLLRSLFPLDWSIHLWGCPTEGFRIFPYFLDRFSFVLSKFKGKLDGNLGRSQSEKMSIIASPQVQIGWFRHVLGSVSH
jgi:hypothetical protein